MTLTSFKPVEYIKIDVANNFGMDKKDWNQRIEWFDQNEDNLEQLVNSAESPTLYFAGVQAYREHQAGKPIGYPVGLDATTSNLQMFSVLIGCENTAKYCNVVDTGHRQNARDHIKANMIDLLGGEFNVPSEDFKKACMTHFFGSKAEPRGIFGEGTRLLEVFYEVINTLFPLANSLNESLIATWQPNNYSHSWVMPDNFHVDIDVMGAVTERVIYNNNSYEVTHYVNKPEEFGVSNSANVCHATDSLVLREVTGMAAVTGTRKKELDFILSGEFFLEDAIGELDPVKDNMVMTLWSHYRESGFLSVRILNYLTEYNIQFVDKDMIVELMNQLPEKEFKVAAIHDKFLCHPNYGNELRYLYNTVLAKIVDSNLLQFIVSQIVGHSVTVQKGGLKSEDVMAANYAIC